MKSDNNWLFDIFLFDIFSFLIPGIVQFEVANYSAKCVFSVFAVENFNLRFSVYERKIESSPRLCPSRLT